MLYSGNDSRTRDSCVGMCGGESPFRPDAPAAFRQFAEVEKPAVRDLPGEDRLARKTTRRSTKSLHLASAEKRATLSPLIRCDMRPRFHRSLCKSRKYVGTVTILIMGGVKIFSIQTRDFTLTASWTRLFGFARPSLRINRVIHFRD